MNDEGAEHDGRLLAKLRPSERLFGLAGRIDLEPVRPESPDGAGPTRLGLDGQPQWFKVRTEPAASPWDQAHARVADQLGIDEADVVFVEPDLQHGPLNRGLDDDTAGAMAIGEDCRPIGQDGAKGKATGDGFAWHLGRSHSRLGRARDAVDFAEPRTRVAHLDTGYSARHETRPLHINARLQRNFVDGEPRGSAIDPDNDVFLMDNSGHGTGTLSVLAGHAVSAAGNEVLGGAPEAEIVPIRVADRVVLLRTSAVASALLHAADARCAVASMSMGGWPSRAWADAVDEAYERGLCLVAAGGNRFGEGPPRSLVYPARYDRVIAVTGVMANGQPYENLDGLTMEGSFGPRSAMGSAIAAYTPNIPWATFGCPEMTRLDGEGTSAATPQVAAAAALWIERYKDVLRADWRRVEAVRHALFSTAKSANRVKHFGNGILQADKALEVRPDLSRRRSDRSRHRFAVWRMLTGFGIEGESAREEMFNLELAQLWMTNETLFDLLPDPDEPAGQPIDDARYQAIVEAIVDDPGASTTLRRHLRDRAGQLLTPQLPVPELDRGVGGTGTTTTAAGIEAPPDPPYRRLRVFAKDPTLASSLATSPVGEVILQVPWEPVAATPTGFRGEYLEVIEDSVPARPVPEAGPDGAPAPGLLDDPRLLAQDGWAPSPGNIHFHQQMVYAVTSRTIEHFERALGRPVMWRPQAVPPRGSNGYEPRLRLRPHALEAANAYYSPQSNAILFGHFSSASGSPSADDGRPAGLPIYTCLSYDIIAHETTHAILDGMYRNFAEPTNRDVLAFHEAFSDLVALLQSFDLTELLEHEIRGSRGDLKAETLLGKLAVQFGAAVRGREALRSAIGTATDDGQWIRSTPDPSLMTSRDTPHGRGAILVSAVFDALIGIYEGRTADLFRIATGGTGLLPDGAIHPDLTNRLASEAAKSARHLLRMCIRALDYLPPVDVTFFDFLRALITADYEFVRDDQYNYRLAIIEAFTKRGIGPGPNDASTESLRSLSPDAIRWPAFADDDATGARAYYEQIVKDLAAYAEACVSIRDRETLFRTTLEHRNRLQDSFATAFETSRRFRPSLGLADGPFEVHALRRAMRARPNGRVEPEVIVSLTQSQQIPADDEAGTAAHRVLGGVTLIVNLSRPDLPRYRIVKGMANEGRRQAMADFALANAADPLRQLYLAPGDGREQFAALHHLAEG